jgi:hypothetical protein
MIFSVNFLTHISQGRRSSFFTMIDLYILQRAYLPAYCYVVTYTLLRISALREIRLLDLFHREI